MINDVVIYDACVLYPAPLRDLLMHMALLDLYSAKWTNEIHEEWIIMNESVRDSLVVRYKNIMPTLPMLPDQNDTHVLAAAIHTNASIILLRI